MRSDAEKEYDDTASGDLVPSTDDDKQQQTNALIQSVFGALGGRAMHNFGSDKQMVWRLTSLATGPDCVSGADWLDKPIDLKYFYVHQVQLEGDSPGEFSDAVRCVLITSDGKALAFVSNGIASDLARLISVFGLEPYVPPVKVKIRQFSTRGKRKMFSLSPV